MDTQRTTLPQGGGGRRTSALQWTFEISRLAMTRQGRSHPSRPWLGDYGGCYAVARTEAAARAIVTRRLISWKRLNPDDGPYVAGDLLEVRAGDVVLWANFCRREDPYLPNPAKRSAAAARALARWRAGR